MNVPFFIVMAALIVAFVLVLLRSRRLREKYAALWVIVGIASIVLASFPFLLETAADLLGFAVPSNLLFTLAIMLLLAVCLHLSLELSNHEDETRALAENVAILDAELRELHRRHGHAAAPREYDPHSTREAGTPAQPRTVAGDDTAGPDYGGGQSAR